MKFSKTELTQLYEIYSSIHQAIISAPESHKKPFKVFAVAVFKNTGISPYFVFVQFHFFFWSVNSEV